jgi:thiol-disulfide isomerase/thioredoxin
MHRVVAFAAVLLRAAAAPLVLSLFGIVAAVGVPADAAAQMDRRPWLGIAMDADGSGPGVRVGHVVRGSPADRAGIRAGDRVVRIASAPVARSADVLQAIGARAVGDALTIDFQRAGLDRTVRAVLAPFPSPDEMVRMDLVGAFAPAWIDLETVSGSFPPTLGAVRGRVVLLDFWATWCAPCRVVVPKLDALQARYGAQGLSVLGVSTEDARDVADFAQRTTLRYPIAVDKRAATSRSYGVLSLPTLVVIDKRGIVRDVAIGYDSSEDARLDSAIRTLLAEPAPADR